MPSYNTLEGLVSKLNASDAVKSQLKGERKIVQFLTDGDKFVLLIREDGSAELKPGAESLPTVTLSATEATMNDILTGKLNGVQAFITGKLKLSGNIMAAQKLVSALEKAK